MFKNLCAGAVGISGTSEELAALANKTGFGGSYAPTGLNCGVRLFPGLRPGLS